jgi:two-component system chemotaxis sensor kinase CheA
MKSEANLLGLSGLGSISHRIEDLLDRVRSHAIPFDEKISTLLLQGVDEFKAFGALLLANPEKALDERFEGLLASIDSIVRSECVQNDNIPDVLEEEVADSANFESDAAPTVEAVKEVSVAEPGSYTPTVPDLDLSEGDEMIREFLDESQEHLSNAENAILTLENDPHDKDAVNLIFRAFHTIKGVSSFFNFTDIKTLAHTSETMLDLVRKDALDFSNKVADATLTSIDQLRSLFGLLAEQAASGGVLQSAYINVGPHLSVLEGIIKGEHIVSTPKVQPIGEIMIDEGMITSVELDQALSMQESDEKEQKIGTILKDMGVVREADIDRAVKIQSTKIDSSIKISVEKLDILIDLVGELVISETQVVQNSSMKQIQDRRLIKDISELDRITRTLQRCAMSMRLVPVKSTFQKMVRIIRDLSRKANKDINVVLVGEDTEIDKNMVELISDPLIHMVRNSADHGIEPRDVRVARNKTPMGTITLSAFHKGGCVVIQIKDDGGGLNKEKILAKAKERGIIGEDELLPDKRIWSLIFEAGFSTAEKVTDVSGRGVGMDVVRKNIEQLRGKIDIDSESGVGCSFSIYLPLTLAIIEGIVFRIGRERYILPISSVVEFVTPEIHKLTYVVGSGDVYKFQEQVISMIHLDKLFNIAFTHDDFLQRTLCVFDSEYGRYCMAVDEVIGQQQVVIKSLGERLKGLHGVSGAAILGNGRVGLILDVNGLVDYAKQMHHNECV